MKSVVRLLLIIVTVTMTVLAFQANTAHVLAAGDCTCTADNVAYDYATNNVQGRDNYTHGPSYAYTIGWCASQICGPEVLASGGALCTTYGLRNGVGYVILNWSIYYYSGGGSSGSWSQQYDCDDL